MKYNTEEYKQIAYNDVHDSFSSAKTLKQLEEAVIKSTSIIKSNRLDKYSQEKLHDYGVRRIYEIQHSNDRELTELARNKKNF